MAQFNQMVPTKVGLALLAKAQAGECKIVITKAVSGDGEWTTDLSDATALKSQKQSFGISSKEIQNDTTVNIKAIISNQNLNEGYYIREYGIMAAEADESEESETGYVAGTEVLYAILTAQEDKADYLPPYNSISPQTITMETLITVASAAEVTILAGTGAYALADDLNALEGRVDEAEEKLDDHEDRIVVVEAQSKAFYVQNKNLFRAQGEQIPVTLSQLHDELAAGNYEHLIIGNHLPMAFRGKTYHMSLAGINHFIRMGANDFSQQHLLWISDELFETAQKYNETNDNTGGYPASSLYTFVQAMYNDLPAEWKNLVVAVPRIRDKKGADEWYYEDKMILPSEMEIFGEVFFGTNGAERDKKQWPIFMGGTARIIKNLNGGGRYAWWTSSASAAHTTYFVYASHVGDSHDNAASSSLGVPIAFCTSKATA